MPTPDPIDPNLSAPTVELAVTRPLESRILQLMDYNSGAGDAAVHAVAAALNRPIEVQVVDGNTGHSLMSQRIEHNAAGVALTGAPLRLQLRQFAHSSQNHYLFLDAAGQALDAPGQAPGRCLFRAVLMASAGQWDDLDAAAEVLYQRSYNEIATHLDRYQGFFTLESPRSPEVDKGPRNYASELGAPLGPSAPAGADSAVKIVFELAIDPDTRAQVTALSDEDAPAVVRAGIQNSEFSWIFSETGSRKLLAPNYPFLNGQASQDKFDPYALTFFPTPGSQGKEIMEIDGALIARTVNARDQQGQPLITKFVDAFSGSATYGNFVRAIGYFTSAAYDIAHISAEDVARMGLSADETATAREYADIPARGFNGEVVINDINPLIPLTQRQMLENFDSFELEVKNVVRDLVNLAAGHGFVVNADDLSVMSERGPGQVQIGDAEYNARFVLENNHNGPKSASRLSDIQNANAPVSRLRHAIKGYFDQQFTACQQPGATSDLPPAINPASEARAAALFYLTQNGAFPSGRVAHRTLAQGSTTNGGNGTRREYHLPLQIIISDGHYTPRGGGEASRRVYLLPNKLPLLKKTMDTVRHFYRDGAGGDRLPTRYTQQDGFELIKNADSKTLVFVSGHFQNDFNSINQFIGKLLPAMHTGWNNGGRFIIINKYHPVKAGAFAAMGLKVGARDAQYLVVSNYDPDTPNLRIQPFGAPVLRLPALPRPLKPTRRMGGMSAKKAKLEPAASAPDQERLLTWREVRDTLAPAFSEQGEQLGATVRHAPQAIWLDTDSSVIRRGRCAGLALAWSLEPESNTLFDNLFTSAAHPGDAAASQFRQDIDRLQAAASSTALTGIDSFDQAVDYLTSHPQQPLLLDVGNHRVALSVEGHGATARYRFFDPNAGEWARISSDSALKTALAAHFTPELCRQYAFEGRIQAFVAAPPVSDVANSVWQRARQVVLPHIEQLARQDRLSGPLALDGVYASREEWFRFGERIGQRARDTPVGASSLPAAPRGQSALLVSGSGMRAYGAYSSVRSVVDNFQQGRPQAAAIDLGSLGSELAGEALERGIGRLGLYLQSALTNARSAAAGAGQSIGRLLGRGAGIVATLVTLPFDLYTAVTSFIESKTKTGLERQDLLFSGGMATLSAAVGISLAIAAAAGAGAVAGPVGLVFGGAMITASLIYGAVRQVQDVEQWVTLSAGERLTLGWNVFVGNGLDQATELRMLQAQGDQLVQQQTRAATRVLLDAPEPAIGAALTPTQTTVARLLKHVSSSDHAHRHLVEQAESSVRARPGGFEGFVEAVAGEYMPINPKIAPPEHYEVYIQASNDDLDVERDRAAAGVIWQSNGRDDLPVQINLGDGNDRLVGSRARANRVQLGSGNKTVIGGAQDDIVSLDATPAWLAAAGVSLHDRYDLDGAAGSDTLALETDFAEQTARGYRVDLAAQTLDLIERDGRFTPLGAVRHFEHLLHARGAGAHQLYGDAGNNTLSGNGRDRLYGRGGNDLLRVAGSVFADGGDGDDVYLVSALAAGDQVTLQDSGQTRAEAPGRSVVYLDFALEQISDWRVEGHDLVLTIASGARVTVKDVYQTQDGQRGLRSGHWAFATRDGFTLAPQLPVTLSDAQDASDFMIDALYVPAADRSRADTQGGVELDLAARRVAHRAPPLQRKRATDSPADQPMAGGLQLGPRYRLSGSGGDQADIVRGTAGDDVLRAGRGYDRLIGNGGSDVFVIEAEPGAVEIDTRAPAGATPGAQNALVLASLLGRAELSISGDDVLIRAEMPPASARAAPPTRTIRHLGGARAERPAPLFIIDAQGSQLHWQVEHNADGQATIAHYTQIAGSVGCALGARAGARNLLLGGAGADTLFAQSPGQLLRGGGGADRYIVDWMPATDADSEAYLIDNQAEDGALDTLEIRTTLPPGHFALARINDDLAITERLPGTEAHAEQRVAAMILVDYYRAGAQRHLALELSAVGGMITQRIEADELEQLALDPEIARLTPAPSAALARLLQASAGFGAAGGADLSAAQTTAMIAPQALLAAV